MYSSLHAEGPRRGGLYSVRHTSRLRSSASRRQSRGGDPEGSAVEPAAEPKPAAAFAFAFNPSVSARNSCFMRSWTYSKWCVSPRAYSSISRESGRRRQSASWYRLSASTSQKCFSAYAEGRGSVRSDECRGGVERRQKRSREASKAGIE